MRAVAAIAPLRSEELAVFAPLTYPVMRRLLDPAEAPRLVCVGARDGADPVGLALGVVADAPPGLCELASFHVPTLLRHGALPAELLAAWEAAAAARGCRRAIHFFVARGGEDPTARFLLDRGWGRPVVRNLVCRATVGDALATPWLARARIPRGYRAVAWGELTGGQRAALAAPEAGARWYPEVLDPFRHERGRDPATSLALLEDAGEGGVRVVGWAINHALDARTLRWTSSYLRPDLQAAGAVLPLWREVVCRQHAAAAFPEFVFSVAVDQQPRMARLVDRWMRPRLADLSFGCFATKRLTPAKASPG